MSQNPGFRGWYYFRNGWSVYFAFIFAAINTLTVTYYLAIDRAPILKEIFPSFVSYVVIVTIIGIPLLVLIGYVHYKRTSAFKSETSIQFESNPFPRRTLVNSEIILKLNLEILELITKTKNLSDDETKRIKELKNEIGDLLPNRKLNNPSDLDYLKSLYD